MALTEKYVSSSAGGSGDGNSAGSPYTFSQMVSEIAAGSGGNKRYNIKADGTYTRSSSDNLASQHGSASAPVVLRGYHTTPGDGWQGRDSKGVLDLSKMPLISYTSGNRWQSGGNHYYYESLRFEGDVNNWVLEINNFSAMLGCSVKNINTGGSSATVFGGNRVVMLLCDFLHTGASGSGNAMEIHDGCMVDSCRFIVSSSSRNAFRLYADTSIIKCLFIGAGGGQALKGESGSNGLCIRDNTFYNWSIAIKMVTTEGLGIILGNMITDCASYGIDLSGTSAAMIIAKNRFRDNTSGNVNSGGSWFDASNHFPGGAITTDTGGASTDYLDTSSQDFNLVDASPGFGTNVNANEDMGAFQKQRTGGGGSTVFNPLGQFIVRAAA